MISTITIVRLLLSIVSALIKSANDAKQREIVKDELVRQQLSELVVNLKIAKQIDLRTKYMSDDDIDDVLQPYYRD